MADVAFLSQVPASTLSRLWKEVDWLDRVSGATLQQLICALPGLARYVERRSHVAHLESVLRECTESGLVVRPDRLASVFTDGRSVHYMATALRAAASMMRSDPLEAAAHLARCWGSQQSIALDALILPAPQGVLVEPDLLIGRARELVDVMERGKNSLHTTVGYGVLVHKVTRQTGAVPVDIPPSTPDRSSAFAYRSGVIGTLLSTGDPAAAASYHRQLERNPLLRRNELWSLATFGGDISQMPDFGVRIRGGLPRTVADVLADIADLNEGYLHYLVTTAIPVVLDYDPSFGAAKSALRQALQQRLERGIDDEQVRHASAALMKSMQ